MSGPNKVGDATSVIVSRTGGQTEITRERAAELQRRFYPTVFRDGVDTRVRTDVADNETPAIATPGTETSTVRRLDDDAITQLVTGALAAGVSADRRAQTIKTLILQERPDAALAVLQGANDQGQLGELLLALSTLDGPGVWTARLSLSANDPGVLCVIVGNAPADARAAALSILAAHAETEAGHAAIRQLLSAAARDQSLEDLVRRLDNMRFGETATVREVLIASMAAQDDSVSLLHLGASGVEDVGVQPNKKVEPEREEDPEPSLKPEPALTPAAVTEVIKSSTPEIMVSKVERGLREHPEAARKALAALATLKSRGMVVVAEGSRAGGVAKEAFWGVISVDTYNDVYKDGLTHDGYTYTRPGQTLDWELTEATRYVDEVLNCTFENGAWRPRTAEETVAVLQQRYPRVFGPSTDGRVHFDTERINAPPYEIRDNQLVSNVETFTPTEFARAIAETDIMLTFHELATAHPGVATYDGQRTLTVRTGNGEVRLVIAGDRVTSPDAPADVRASGDDVRAWVTRVAQPDAAQSPAQRAAAVTHTGAVQALTAAAQPWQAKLRDQLGFAGIEFQAIGENKVRMVAAEEGATRHLIADLNLVDSSGRRLPAETLAADAELALASFLMSPTQPMPAAAEQIRAWNSILHEANHYARRLGHAGVIAVPHGTNAEGITTTPSGFDPALTYDFYLLGRDGSRTMVTQMRLATQGGAEMFTPSVCIRDVRSGIYNRHSQLTPAANDMTPANWDQVNGWLASRPESQTRATVAGNQITWAAADGSAYRVNLDLPAHVQAQVIDDNIVRFVNTTGTFRVPGAASRDLYIAFEPGTDQPHPYMFAGHTGRVADLGVALDDLLFNGSTTEVTIAGRNLPVRGPGLGGHVQLVSGVTALLYDPSNGRVSLGHGWQDDGGTATFLDGDISDGSVVVRVDYSALGEGVQIWKIDLDFDSGDADASYNTQCILNTTSVPIVAAQDATDTEMARAELARLGVDAQQSTRLPGFNDLVAGTGPIDGQQLLLSLQTVPDDQATVALEALLAVDPARVTPPNVLLFAIKHFTVVESAHALNHPPGDDELVGNMILELAAGHDALVEHHGDFRAGNAALRRLVAQATAAEMPSELPGARLNLFLSLAYRELTGQQ